MTIPHYLGEAATKAFMARGIDPETVAKYEIYTGKSSDGGVVPDLAGNIVVFPFIDHGKHVGEKYRAPNKRFWQKPPAKKTFWNADALDDPALHEGRMQLVITEGEIDALTAIECGFPLTVSVPDGAPAGVSAEPDPSEEKEGKFSYLWNNRERLKKIKWFILAVDSDEPGKNLAAELVRRLSAARCLFVIYPDDCKDLNDILVKYGVDKVREVLNGATPYPVRGLFSLDDCPRLGHLETVSSGWPILDQHLKLFPGEFMVVTGIPSHGKSTLILNLLVNIAEQHQWKSAIFSPEMPVIPFLRDKMRRMVLHGEPTERADQFINNHFVFIIADASDDIYQDFDFDWVIDRATDAVLRYGIRVLLVDCWNELEHGRRREEMMTDYVARSIRAFKRFAQTYGVAVIIVAHPTKEVGREGKHRVPTLYDIEQSAAWFNKADHGLVINRPDQNDNVADVYVAKSRFEEAGERGMVKLRYNRHSGRFVGFDMEIQ